jgi:hypothetical protein
MSEESLRMTPYLLFALLAVCLLSACAPSLVAGVAVAVDTSAAACRGILAEDPQRSDKIGEVCRKVLGLVGAGNGEAEPSNTGP